MSDRNRCSIRKGAHAALLAAFLFGISSPIAKMLLGEVQPVFLAGFLYLGSGIGLTMIWAAGILSDNRKKEAGLRGKDYLYLIAAIICGGVLGPIFLTTGLSRTYSSITCLLLNLEGIMTALLACLFFREAVGSRILIASGAMLLGGAVLSYNQTKTNLSIDMGAIFIMGACLMWALDNNITCSISGKDPYAIARVKGLCAGMTSVSLALILGERMPPGVPILGSLVLGAFGYGLSLVLCIYSFRHLGSARTGILFGLGPFVGAIASVFLLNEPVTWKLGISSVLMIIGACLLLKEKHAHNHKHEEISHEHGHRHDDGHHFHFHDDDEENIPLSHTHRHLHECSMHDHQHAPDLHHKHVH
jgi:drug/metabolite transporter (DMT)-like permease